MPGQRQANGRAKGQGIRPQRSGLIAAYLLVFAIIAGSAALVVGGISVTAPEVVDKAVAAAKAAFPSFSQTSVEYRADLLDKITAGFKARLPEIGEAIEIEMGAPTWLAQAVQAPTGLGHFATAALKDKSAGRLHYLRQELAVLGTLAPHPRKRFVALAR